MITIRSFMVVVAFSAGACADIQAKSKTTGSSARVSKRAKRDVSMIRIAWGTIKASFGFAAGWQALGYAFVPGLYLFEGRGSAHCVAQGLFEKDSWHEAGLKKVALLWYADSKSVVNSCGEPIAPVNTVEDVLSRGSGLVFRSLEESQYAPITDAACIFVAVASIPLAYIAYRLVKSGINTWRDEFIASAGLEDFDTVEDENIH